MCGISPVCPSGDVAALCTSCWEWENGCSGSITIQLCRNSARIIFRQCKAWNIETPQPSFTVSLLRTHKNPPCRVWSLLDQASSPAADISTREGSRPKTLVMGMRRGVERADSISGPQRCIRFTRCADEIAAVISFRSTKQNTTRATETTPQIRHGEYIVYE